MYHICSKNKTGSVIFMASGLHSILATTTVIHLENCIVKYIFLLIPILLTTSWSRESHEAYSWTSRYRLGLGFIHLIYI